MIPYMVGKLAPNSTHSTRGLVKYIPGKGCFRAVSSQNGEKFVTSPPPSPPIIERVLCLLCEPSRREAHVLQDGCGDGTILRTLYSRASLSEVNEGTEKVQACLSSKL